MLNNKTAHTLFYKRNPEKKKLSTSPVFQYEVCFYDCGNKKQFKQERDKKRSCIVCFCTGKIQINGTNHKKKKHV